jgi:hypothetical protein
LTGLFCFENNKLIFEGVHRSFKFVVLTFVKTPVRPELVEGCGSTSSPRTDTSESSQAVLQSFPAAFMRHEVSELMNFPHADSLLINTDLIKKLSPDSWSIMEFKNERDIIIAEKMLRFPLLGEQLADTWNLKLTREFDMTNDSYLFKTENAEGRLPLYEGKIIHQFTHVWGEPKYWIDELEGRKAVLGSKKEDSGQVLDYQGYRLAFRDVAASTNERTMIATILPPNVFTGNTLVTSMSPKNNSELLFIVALLNSFVADALIRQKVTAHCNMFYIYQLPIPRLTEKDPQFKAIVERAAALICTTPEFDDLKQAVGVQAPLATGKQSLHSCRAELDAMIAHLYGLTEDEFAHVLNTFPIVKEDVKAAALAAFNRLWVVN